jgi:hypothetical protein
MTMKRRREKFSARVRKDVWQEKMGGLTLIQPRPSLSAIYERERNHF